MGKKELDILSKEELEAIKGGGRWIYNEANDKWYWIEGRSVDNSD